VSPTLRNKGAQDDWHSPSRLGSIDGRKKPGRPQRRRPALETEVDGGTRGPNWLHYVLTDYFESSNGVSIRRALGRGIARKIGRGGRRHMTRHPPSGLYWLGGSLFV